MLKPFVRTVRRAPSFTVGKIYWVDTDSVCGHVPSCHIVRDDDDDERAFFEKDFRQLLLRDAFVSILQECGVSAQDSQLAAQRLGRSTLEGSLDPDAAGRAWAAECLWFGFVWAFSPEGHDFWAAITRKVAGEE